MYATTRGLVLREVKYKESDKILTVLTQDMGKITVGVRGALRKSSRVTAASQQLVFSEMTLFGRNGRWSMNEAETIEQFLGLRRDLGSFALGGYFAELLEAVSDEDSPNPEMLALGLNALFALSRGMHSPEHIKAVFELRLMCLAGYEPQLYGCGVCGNENIEDPLFSLNGGILHCRGCFPGGAGVSMPLCRGSLDAMRHIVSAGAKRIFSFELDKPAAEELYDICEAYVPAQLGRSFGTLNYWKQVR